MRAAWPAGPELPGQLAVRRRRPVRDLLQRAPDAPLERGAVAVELQLERRALAVEVLLELLGRSREHGRHVVILVERGCAAWEVEVSETSAACDQRQQPERALKVRVGHRAFTSWFRHQAASWKMTPSAVRCPAVTVLTPWRKATRW